MATFLTYATQPEAAVVRPALYDHVFVADGRTGYVIGYRRENASVLVLFASGDFDEFPHSEVLRLS